MFKAHSARFAAAFGLAAMLGTAGLAGAQSKFNSTTKSFSTTSSFSTSSTSKLNLTSSQQAQIREILVDVQSDFQAFQNKYGQRLGELRRLQSQAMSSGKAFHPSLARELKSIELSAPSIDSLRDRVWAVLTPQQQSIMNSEMKSIQSQRLAHQSGQRVKSIKHPISAKDSNSMLKSSGSSSSTKSIASGASTSGN